MKIDFIISRKSKFKTLIEYIIVKFYIFKILTNSVKIYKVIK